MYIVFFEGSLFTFNSTAKLIHEMIMLTRKFYYMITLENSTNEKIFRRESLLQV